MTPRTYTLKPGVLVACKTYVRGGRTYSRRDLPAGAPGVERWETTKVVEDPEELDRAQKARGRGQSLIRGACVPTSFGLWCSNENEADLKSRIDEAREIARTHNAGANCTRIGVFAIVARIADNDSDAARAIAGDVADLIASMEAGIKELDTDAIRRAATQARSMLDALPPDRALIASAAIEQARAAAKSIAKRIEKKGERAAEVLASLETDALTRARTVFLDLEDTAEPAAQPVPVAAVPDVEGADETPADPVPEEPTAEPAPEVPDSEPAQLELF
jgi:hypothetical protein